jgi:hypothetical protein
MKINLHREGILVIASDIAIRRFFSTNFLSDLTQAIDSALARYGIVNIPVLAEQVRKRNERENIALEDIEAKIMELAQRRCAMMEFETPQLPM